MLRSCVSKLRQLGKVARVQIHPSILAVPGDFANSVHNTRTRQHATHAKKLRQLKKLQLRKETRKPSQGYATTRIVTPAVTEVENPI